MSSSSSSSASHRSPRHLSLKSMALAAAAVASTTLVSSVSAASKANTFAIVGNSGVSAQQVCFSSLSVLFYFVISSLSSYIRRRMDKREQAVESKQGQGTTGATGHSGVLSVWKGGGGESFAPLPLATLVLHALSA